MRIDFLQAKQDKGIKLKVSQKVKTSPTYHH